MRTSKVNSTILAAVTFSATLLLHLGGSIFTVQFIPNSSVLAQSTDARKTEADRLLQQGIEQ